MKRPVTLEEAMVLLAVKGEERGDGQRAAEWWEHLAKLATNDVAKEYRIQRAELARNRAQR